MDLDHQGNDMDDLRMFPHYRPKWIEYKWSAIVTEAKKTKRKKKLSKEEFVKAMTKKGNQNGC